MVLPAGDRPGLNSPWRFGPDGSLLIHVSHLSGHLRHGAGLNRVKKRMWIVRRSASLAILSALAVALAVLVSAAPRPGHARDYARDEARDYPHDNAHDDRPHHPHDRDRHRRDQVRRAVESGEIKSLAEILKIVQDKLPGEVAGVEIDQDDGRWRYEFRVVDSHGRLFEVYVDARSGDDRKTKEK